MTAAADAVEAAYVIEIAKISDTLINAKATYALERWVAGAAALAGIESGAIVSYSIAGRTFTRNTATSFKEVIDGLQSELESYIYGRTRLVDHNLNIAES